MKSFSPIKGPSPRPRCQHTKHGTYDEFNRGWIMREITPCGPHGCDAGGPFKDAKHRRDVISRAVAEKLLPAIAALDDVKANLMARFSLSPVELLEIHRDAIVDRMGRIK
jgi:hypothetical protein